jgi:hypothetical protein
MSNMGVKMWTVKLIDDLHSIGPAFVWRKQHEGNMRGMIRVVKERYKDIERQNLLAHFAERSSLKCIENRTLYGVRSCT